MVARCGSQLLKMIYKIFMMCRIHLVHLENLVNLINKKINVIAAQIFTNRSP